MRKTWLQNLLCFSMTVCLLTGCGGEYTGMKDNGAVSGDAVSGAAVEEETDRSVSGHRFANSTNFYGEYTSPDPEDEDEPIGLLQYRLDGTKMQTLKIKDFEGLISVDEESVYYSRWKSGTGYSKVCRIPIEKGEDGDRNLDPEKEEVIYTTRSEIADSEMEPYMYIDDRDIVYIGSALKQGSQTELTCEVVRYDREKKEEVPLREQPECPEDSSNVANALIIVGSYDRKLILSSLEYGLYCLDLDTDELDLIRKGKDILFSPIPDKTHLVSRGNLVYIVKEWNGQNSVPTLYRYDLETKKDEVLVSESEAEEAVLKQGLVQGGKETIHDIELTRYFVQGDRLYLQYQIGENDGQEMKARYVILYKSISQNSELACEKELTECLAENSDSLCGTAKWYDEENKKEKQCLYAENVGSCLQMANGKAILLFVNKAEKEIEFGCYDLASGECKKIAYESEEWYEPYYDELEPYWYWWWAVTGTDAPDELKFDTLYEQDRIMHWVEAFVTEIDWEKE